MKLKSILIIIGIVSSLAISVMTIYFIYNFKNQYVSSNISDWGDFGTFFWGFITCLVSILNLIIFVILTIHVSRIQENWNNFNFHFEKKKMFTDYRHKGIEELSRITNGYLINIANKLYEKGETDLKYIHFETVKLIENLNSYIPIYAYFFEEIINDINTIIKIAENIRNNIEKKQNFNHEEFIKDLKDYRKTANITVSNLQQFNVTKLIEK